MHIGFFGSVSGAVHQKNPNVRKQSVQKSDLQKSAFWRVFVGTEYSGIFPIPTIFRLIPTKPLRYLYETHVTYHPAAYDVC